MVRSLYAGVMGIRTHQSRLDVIGNNIANVSTYGYKSSRATFKDVYYQTLSGASSATAERGGKNPTEIGYGSTLNSIDVMHGQQGLQMTDRGLDVAITGEGFLQVKDADGNIFYTRAGILDFDEAGNLVDSNGNFVLGVSGNPLGKAPGSEKIQFSIPPVDPTQASVKEKINGVDFSITASKAVSAGNVRMQIISVADLPSGQQCAAEINSSSILIKLNKFETFKDMTDLQTAINDAITEANGGVKHPAGDFQISCSTPDKLNGLTGEELASKDYSPVLGKVTGLGKGEVKSGNVDLGIEFVEAGSGFTATGLDGGGITQDNFTLTKKVGGATGDGWEIAVGDYKGFIPASAKTAGQVLLKKDGTDDKDCFIVTHSGYNYLETIAGGSEDNPVAQNTEITIKDLDAKIEATKTEDTKAMGLSSVDFLLKGGTEGGAQGVGSLSNIAIGSNGVVEAYHAVYGRMELGRIDLVTFENPGGLSQAGNTYFQETANSGKAKAVEPGTSGSGGLQAGALELSAVDLGKEFADMITTQRGLQANSRIITVSDEVLNELINLKR